MPAVSARLTLAGGPPSGRRASGRPATAGRSAGTSRSSNSRESARPRSASRRRASTRSTTCSADARGCCRSLLGCRRGGTSRRARSGQEAPYGQRCSESGPYTNDRRPTSVTLSLATASAAQSEPTTTERRLSWRTPARALAQKTRFCWAFVARPRGFEPLTFGSVDLALASHFNRSDAPERRQKIEIAASSTGASCP